jgi:putative photosynthetic complex assembly protein
MIEEAIDAKPFPRGMLIAAGLLILSSLIFAAVARHTGYGATRLELGTVAATREVIFTDEREGMISAFDASTGERIADIQNIGNGFVGVVLKGFARDRSVAGLKKDLPFRISTIADGRSMIEDPSTGRIVMLGAFGADNLKAFSQLLTKRSDSNDASLVAPAQH